MRKAGSYNLSSQWLGPWKHFLLLVYVAMCIFLIAYFFSKKNAIFYFIFQGSLYAYVLYRLIKMANRLQQVSFDERFLYVIDKAQELVIPLENIESVEIETLGGVYKVNALHAEQFGKQFYFKPSLFYPLNYKKKDALVNNLRRQIQRAKNRKSMTVEKELPS